MTPLVWQVGALCRAVADALQARFNPVAVRGEISGFTRAASGHCYFTLKDAQGQLRCAMFRRAAQLLDFSPRDGEQVEISGRLGVYEPRGELQLVVEGMRRAGLGTLFEQFLQRKAKLEAEGLFEPSRKRDIPRQPRAIGIVTSLAAAALYDVATALARRVPHIPVFLAPAPVQGTDAAPAMVQALQDLSRQPEVEVILLVRGGGSMEDLWAFNDETLARTIAHLPVPVVSGIGHETDFTLADFCADLRAPTPTAAAELCATPRSELMQALSNLGQRLGGSLTAQTDRQAQRLDRLQALLARPAQTMASTRLRLQAWQQRLQQATRQHLQHAQQRLEQCHLRGDAVRTQLSFHHRERLERAALRLSLLDPQLVLERGYTWLSDESGQPIGSVQQVTPAQTLRATLADGMVELQVESIQPRPIS
jgi:exodeoxyribonuclease VII large subunit